MEPRPLVRRVIVPGPGVVASALAPSLHGTVVYDRGHVDADGFIGISRPHVTLGIGF